jgi:hypothetical protein
MSMRSRVEDALKRLSLAVVPPELLYRLWHHRRKGKPRTEDGTTEELRSIEVQEGVRLDVYWTVVAQGAGPCASLFVLDEEVLRLDCFAGSTAHMHLNPVQLNLPLPWKISPRIAFPPGSAKAQIDRAVFELQMNTKTALQMNQLARLREFPIEREALAVASEEMKSYMLELAARRSETGMDTENES